MELFFELFEIVFELFWGCFGAVLDLLGIGFEPVLELFWSCFGSVFILFLSCFGVAALNKSGQQK